MKVVPINSRMLFKFDAPRAQATVPEGFKLVVGVATTCWIPTLLFCLTIRNALPFVLIFCSEVLGTLLGVLMYKQARYRITSCVPVTRVPKSPAQRARITQLVA